MTDTPPRCAYNRHCGEEVIGTGPDGLPYCFDHLNEAQAESGDTDLPESLRCSPEIPWDQQTIAQLKAERDYWDRQVRTAPGFASANAAAEFRRGCEAWIKRREDAMRNARAM